MDKSLHRREREREKEREREILSVFIHFFPFLHRRWPDC